MRRMGILGPKGTHSEAAAVYLNNIIAEPMELVIYPEIYEVLTAVESGRINAGFVPVENSLEGSINITLDTLARSDNLIVTRELIWPVHNQLMAKASVNISEIKRIYSTFTAYIAMPQLYSEELPNCRGLHCFFNGKGSGDCRQF